MTDILPGLIELLQRFDVQMSAGFGRNFEPVYEIKLLDTDLDIDDQIVAKEYAGSIPDAIDKIADKI